jgi:MFS family permease
MTESLKNSLESLLPAERRAVATIALIAVLRMFGLFALLPVLSLYAAGLDDATPILIGLAVGGYGLTQAALQIPLGALSDRIGRAPVIAGGLAVFAFGSVLAGLSDSIYGVIAGRLLQGAGAISATLTALIADATREQVRTRSMAFFGIIGFGMSFPLGVFAGPLFAEYFGVPALFGLVAVLAIVAALVLKALPQDIEPPETTERPAIRTALRPELLRLDGYIFLLHAILTASFVALPFLLRDRLGLDLIDQGKLYVGALLVSLAGTLPLIIHDDRRGKNKTIGIAILLLLAGQLALTFTAFAILPVFVALVLFFAGFTFLEAGLPARLSILAEGAVRGASLGVFSSAQFLGVFAGGLIGGQFLASGGPAGVFFVCALLAAIWLALHGFGRPRR